ncbi:hypothetical protein M0812_26409 [Anaeramoeba flamelloides]|uniref:Uncharacterized protein n=1 Tax=Anaeramoeba flamelloides TaxID=1746091 RepID=A0AAV7YBG9_9EUKA|nr:hypothetical protein M0812_26409 [Anaeramoeba flamelloides]
MSQDLAQDRLKYQRGISYVIMIFWVMSLLYLLLYYFRLHCRAKIFRSTSETQTRLNAHAKRAKGILKYINNLEQIVWFSGYQDLAILNKVVLVFVLSLIVSFGLETIAYFLKKTYCYAITIFSLIIWLVNTCIMVTKFSYVSRCVFILTPTTAYLYGFKRSNDVQKFTIGEFEKEEYKTHPNGSQDVIFSSENLVIRHDTDVSYHYRDIGFFHLYDMDTVCEIIAKRKRELKGNAQSIENEDELQMIISINHKNNDLENNFHYISQEFSNLPIKTNEEIQNCFSVGNNLDLNKNADQYIHKNSNLNYNSNII